MTTKSRRLLDAIRDDRILVMPGVFDGFSCRLTERNGYTAGFITGSGVSESATGWADMGVMGLDQNVAVARNIASVTDMPLLADGDTGYGNAVNVHFATRAFEAAGVAGVMFEDQVWPKRCGHMSGKEVIPLDEGAAKIRAAREAAHDEAFVIMARTDTLATDGVEEVVRRLNAYAEAGASLLFADALMTAEQIDVVVREVDGPVCVNMGFGIRTRSTTPLLSARQLEELGVAAVIYPRMLTSAALQGMQNAFDALARSLETGEAEDRPDLQFDFETLNSLMGFDDLKALEERHLTEAQKRAKYGQAA